MSFHTPRGLTNCLVGMVIKLARMDFAMSAKGQEYHDKLTEFMVEHVFPAEAAYDAYREEKGPKDFTVPPVVEELKAVFDPRGGARPQSYGVNRNLLIGAEVDPLSQTSVLSSAWVGIAKLDRAEPVGSAE